MNIHQSQLRKSKVRFQVLNAVSVNMTVFWIIAPCSLVEVYDVAKLLAVSIIRAMRPDDGGASTSATSVNFYQTTGRNIPEDSHLLRKSKIKQLTVP
jgi:hypothetical protein